MDLSAPFRMNVQNYVIFGEESRNGEMPENYRYSFFRE